MSDAAGGSPGLAVALETSTRRPSVAVRAGERSLGRSSSGDSPHASDLVARLADLILELGARARDIDSVVVGLGPGSYTGLRVGVAAALGLARGSGAELLGVPSGEALAYERLAPGERCVQLLDARQGELYYARYERTRTDVLTLDGPRVVRPDALSLPAHEPLLGDGSVADAAQLDADARARLDPDAVPSAAALLELGLARLAAAGPHRPEEVRPLYLRPFATRARRR